MAEETVEMFSTGVA